MRLLHERERGVLSGADDQARRERPSAEDERDRPWLGSDRCSGRGAHEVSVFVRSVHRSSAHARRSRRSDSARFSHASSRVTLSISRVFPTRTAAPSADPGLASGTGGSSCPAIDDLDVVDRESRGLELPPGSPARAASTSRSPGRDSVPRLEESAPGTAAASCRSSGER